MDPLDPAKADDSSGFSRRRTSSILKAPRKSIRLPDPEQQENVVESAKPVEKRNSRRVSFAPANNVLLFSSDIKDASLVRSPLQDSATTSATQNRVQVELGEDGIQQITGMETLLSAPLHAAQQREKVHFEADFGEKTVMFSTDDAFMDVTHGQTIIIANSAELGADISLQNCDGFPASRERTVMDANLTSRPVGLGVDRRNMSSPGPCLDPGFENFLASLFKPSDPSVNPSGPFPAGRNDSVAQIKTQRAGVDKENQAPSSVPAAMDKSVITLRKTDQPSHRGELCPQSDVSMDMTETETGRIQALGEYFCPMKETSPRLDRRVKETSPRLDRRVKETSPRLDRRVKEMSPRLDCRVKETSPRLDRRVKETSPRLDRRVKETSPRLDRRVKEMSPRLDRRVKETSPRLDRRVKETSPRLDRRVKETSPRLDRRVKETSPRLDRRVKETSPRLDRRVKETSPRLDRRVKETSPRPDRRVKETSPRPDRRVKETSPRLDCRVKETSPRLDRRVKETSPRLDRRVKETSPRLDRRVKETSPRLDRRASQSNRQQSSGTRATFNPKDMTTWTNPPSASHQRHKQSEDMGSSNYEGLGTSWTVSSKTHQVNFAAEDDLREKTVRFSADEACMDVTQSHTVNIVSDLHQHVHSVPASGDKTVRFGANDAAMDVTQSHTVNIVTGFNQQPQQNLNFPSFGDKTVRFTANDAAMDVTQSHTVNIATGFDPKAPQNLDFEPASGEKTVRFSADEACMDVTQSHTVNIVSDLHQHVHSVPAFGEKTVRFGSSAAAMDVTQSHTVNIVTGFDPEAPQNLDLPASGEKTVRFSADEACMDVTQSHTVHIATGFNQQPQQNLNFPSSGDKTVRFGSSAAAMDVTQSHTVHISSSSVTGRDSNTLTSQQNMSLSAKRESEPRPDGNRSSSAHTLDRAFKNPRSKPSGPWADPVITEAIPAAPSSDAPDRLQVETQSEAPGDQTTACGSGDDGAQTEDILEQACGDGPQQDDSGDTQAASQQNVDVTNHKGYLDNEEEPEPRDRASPTSDDHADMAPSRKTRRMSFADLHTKIRRLSHMVNVAPDTDGCTAPSPQREHDVDRTRSLPEPEEDTEAQYLMEGKQTATPFNLKTKHLMSRLSVGGFKPKLPQRSRPDGPGKEQTWTIDVTDQPSDLDGDVSDIYAEELGSCEDVSEMLDTRSPHEAAEDVRPSQEVHAEGPVEDSVFEEDIMTPMDEEAAADFNMGSQSDFTSAPGLTTQNTDESSSCHSARCKVTSESTFKQSLFESRLEDRADDVQRKLDDGSITALEFFKLFNIDFVIHNPRQSVLPQRLVSDTDRTPMDLFRDRHISRPKRLAYEADILSLTEKVEGLKERMQDLDEPLKVVNRALWEEMRGSSETELRTFGAKLKERNNLFRKMSRVRSHELKEALYSNLVRANQEEQQTLRGRIEEADEILRSLDDCIHKAETELAAVEEKGFEDAPSLKSVQEDMKTVTEALADNDRQIHELETQEKKNSNKLHRLRAETRNLESRIDALHLLNEWELAESGDDCTVYTFLHQTLRLQLVFEEHGGAAADNQPERKISHIIFKHLIDEEKSQGHARLVHTLLSRYTGGESAWVEKYPTSRHVPKLLHDVGLWASCGRLLGEELRLLKMWGGLKLGVLSITCVDTEVHVVFSSLRKLSKFEVIFRLSLTDHLYVLQVHSFRSIIGGTTVQQIKDIVASVHPGKNLLTKTVKRINENLDL